MQTSIIINTKTCCYENIEFSLFKSYRLQQNLRAEVVEYLLYASFRSKFELHKTPDQQLILRNIITSYILTYRNTWTS